MSILKESIIALSKGEQLTADQAFQSVTEIMTGQATPAQTGAFLASLRLPMCTADVIAACAKAMRDQAMPVQAPGCLDIVGTGGDGIDTFNVSTCAGLVCAAVDGVRVMKHGNRSNSSLCGSADLLEALGANLNLNGDQAVRVLDDCGFCFLFANNVHPAMRHVGPARKQTGIRTIFNILGPLTNPCVPTSQISGVFDMSLGRVYAETFIELGMKRAIVLHAHNGLDEISPEGKTHAWFVEDGVITERDISPADFGVSEAPIESVGGGYPADNVKILWDLCDGLEGPMLDYVLCNAGAALYVAGKADSLKGGADLAREVIKNGSFKRVVEKYVAASKRVVQEDEEKQSILEKIFKHRQEQIAQEEKATPESTLLRRCLRSPPNPALDIAARVTSVGPMAVMAEIKRASPSAGDINADIDPVAQALAYAKGGAAAISVLTEPHWFKGSIEDLRAVAKALSSLPNRPAVLLKDFVGSEYHLLQAREAGADSALLIVASLSEAKLLSLIDCARGLGMEPLVEVATEEELEVAVRCGARFIGVNNRDLHTFKMDMGKTARLHALLPGLNKDNRPITFAALSGIKTRADVTPLEAAGVNAILVGETLMRAENPTHNINELLGKPNGQVATNAKICGVKSVEGALAAARAGAAFIGLIFVTKSKRSVDVAQAAQIVKELRAQYPRAGTGGEAVRELVPGCKASTVEEWYAVHGEALQARISSRRPLVVGVFMDHSMEEMNAIAEQVDLDLIQLHGSEGYAVCKQLCRPAVRVVHVVPGETTADQVVAGLQVGAAVILLDTKSSKGSGGTGETFDWCIAEAVSKRVPVIVAGGLAPSNVGVAVRQIRPWGVDVASGTEHAGTPGKVPSKVYEFVHNAHCV